jgi:hypothetical protein
LKKILLGPETSHFIILVARKTAKMKMYGKSQKQNDSSHFAMRSRSG